MEHLDDMNGEEYENTEAPTEGNAYDELIIKADSDIESVHDEDSRSQDREEMDDDSETGQSRKGTESTKEFMIEVHGLPPYYAMGQLKRLMNETLQLKAHKIKPAGNNKDWTYIIFRDEKSRDKALAVLNDYRWKKCTLTAKIATAAEDPDVKKAQEKSKKAQVQDPDDKIPINERVIKKFTPLSHLTYSKQLEEKNKAALAAMRKLGNEMAKVNPELEKWVRFHKLRRKGQICEIEDIVPSPVIDGYRNKCEFDIGISPETKLPTVGFRVSSVAVGPVGHLLHISDTMKKAAELFQDYVQNSEHPPFSPLTSEGVWRQLIVRTTLNDDILVAVVIHPQEFTEDELGDIKDGIVDFFNGGGGSSVAATSIFYREIGDKEPGPEDVKFEHLWGQEHISETVLGKTFRISCESFFQVNTKGCVPLYETVAELAELDGTSVILDICCGTGTIGISLADQCLKIYGVEMLKTTAEDARHNAASNGLANVAIYTGKAEVNMNAVLGQCVKYNTVGVVDPPRTGLSESVIRQFRKCENMSRMIFMTNDPDGLFKNFMDLTRPVSKQYKGEFFVPIKAAVVDLFPHTPQYELLIVFERWEERKWRRIMEGNPLPRDEDYYKRIPAKPEGARDSESEDEESPQDGGMGGWQSTHVAKRSRNREEMYHPYLDPRQAFASERERYEMNRPMYDRRYDDQESLMRRQPSMLSSNPYEDRLYGRGPSSSSSSAAAASPYDRFYTPPADRPYDRYDDRRLPLDRRPAPSSTLDRRPAPSPSDPYRLSREEYDRPFNRPGSDRLDSYRRDSREFMRF